MMEEWTLGGGRKTLGGMVAIIWASPNVLMLSESKLFLGGVWIILWATSF